MKISIVGSFTMLQSIRKLHAVIDSPHHMVTGIHYTKGSVSSMVHLHSSLDPFPSGAQLDENSLLTDTGLLVQLNEVTSLDNGAFLVIRQSATKHYSNCSAHV